MTIALNEPGVVVAPAIEASTLNRAGAAGLTMTIAHSFEDVAHLREEWDALIRDLSGDIYVSFDWCRIWWRHYGPRRALRIFVFHADRKIVAVVPMFCERIWIGPAMLRVAKLVGSDSALTIAAPVVKGEFATEVYRQLAKSLSQSDRPDLICLGPLPEEDASGLSAASVAMLQYEVVARTDTDDVQTVFALPGTFKRYIDSLDKRQKQNYRRDTNLLNREFAVTADVVCEPAALEREFEAFIAMHQQQWDAQGRAGHFGDWPRAEAFNKDLVAELAQLKRVRLVRVLADGKVIAYQYCFVFGNRCYWRLPARRAEASWDRFGLGRVGLIRMIEGMIDQGINWIDGGAGHYPYKVQLGGHERSVRSILMVRKTPLAKLRCRLFLKFAAALHLVYYRLWYLRLAPRLPIRQGPLLTTWIKSRI